MSKLNDVLKLIGTLTKSEKRYITLRIKGRQKESKASEKSITNLFNQLSALIKETESAEEQEGAIVLFKENPTNQKLASTLNLIKLNDFIMGSLRQFNADKPAFKLEESIQDIRILHQKGLNDQALKLLYKVKKEATEKYEDDLKLLELILLERRIKQRSRKDRKSVEGLKKASYVQIDRMNAFLNTYDDMEEILHKVRYSDFSEKMELSETSKRLNEDLNIADQLPFKANLYGLAVLSDYYSYQMVDPQKALVFMEKLVHLFEADQNRINRNPENYIQSLIKLFNKYYLAGKIEKFEPHLAKIKSLLNQNEEIFPAASPKFDRIELSPRAFIYYRLLNTLLIFYVYNIKHPDAQIVLQKASEVMQRKPSIPDSLLLTIYFNIATFYLLNNDIPKAKEYIDQTLAVPSDKRSDIKFRAELLNILILFETCKTIEDKEKFESQLGKLLGIIQDQNKEEVKKLARNFISTLNIILFEEDKKERFAMFKKLQNALPKEDVEKFDFFSFRFWIDKKIEEGIEVN